MKRKRLHPKTYRNRPIALKIFKAMDPAVADDIIILYTKIKNSEGNIEMMSITNPKYET